MFSVQCITLVCDVHCVMFIFKCIIGHWCVMFIVTDSDLSTNGAWTHPAARLYICLYIVQFRIYIHYTVLNIHITQCVYYTHYTVCILYTLYRLYRGSASYCGITCLPDIPQLQERKILYLCFVYTVYWCTCVLVYLCTGVLVYSGILVY